jgi:hypothetical protein
LIVPPGNIALGRRVRRLLFATAFIVLCGATPPALAATRLVAPVGADSGNCATTPCASLGFAYTQSGAGDVVTVAPGLYPGQTVPDGTKAVTFRGAPGVVVRQLISEASNVTYDGIGVDAGGVQTDWAALELHGDNQTFKNAAVGNVVDEKGALITGANHTIDNVLFHDVVLKTDGVHLECLYAIGVPGFTIRNSTFRDCSVMDLFFTYGSWWSPLPPSYGNVTIENNVFEHAEMEFNGGWHYYSLYINPIGPNGAADPISGWVVRNNTFEQSATMAPEQGSNGTRWVNNLGDWDCVPGIAYSHNVGKKCSGTDKQVSPASSSEGATASLGWVNPLLHDFHLKPGSPAINAGDPNDAPALDREGLQRDSQPDAGAHEFGAKRPVGSQGFPTTGLGRVRMFKLARLRPHVICKRKRRHCPKVAKLRLAVRQPAQMTLRVKRIGKGGKRAKTRTLRFNLATVRTLRIRARSLPRGLYRVSVVAANAAGAKSKPRSFKLRVR